MYTAIDMLANTGEWPERDDLDRANCDKAGQLGHDNCGVCVHNKPVFMCHMCFMICREPWFKRLNQPVGGSRQ